MRTVFDQRVAYLVEHGGLWADPMREYSRTNRKLIIVCIVLTVVQILQVVWMQ